MTTFSYVAIPLLLFSLLFVVLPLLSGRKSSATLNREGEERRRTNIAAYKERLAELEVEHEQGLYDEQEVSHLKVELERTLLGDVEDQKQPQGDRVSRGVSWPVAAAITLFVPITAWLLYTETGAVPDLMIADSLKQVQTASSEEQSLQRMRVLVDQLNERLATDSPDPHYLMLLGRSQMQLQNFPAAADAFQRLLMDVGEDPMVMGNYAQALYLASGRTLTDQVKTLVEQVLTLQPFNRTVLGMMGMASYEEGNFAAAADYWKRLLRVLDPESDNAILIARGVEQALLQIGEDPVVEPIEPTAAVTVNVSIAKGLQALAGDSVFVFARALQGPKMPLAVARLQVADLPTSIVLDDSMAMAPGLKLSNFDQVEVVARISKRGIANRGSGDMEGRSEPIQLKELDGGVSVLIADVVP